MLSHLKKHVFGILALSTGTIAIICAVIAHHVIEPPARHPQPSQASISLDLFGQNFSWESKEEPALPPPAPKPWLTQEKMRLVGVYVAIGAIILAVASWIRKEGIWYGFGATSFALAACAWYVFLGIVFLLSLSGGIFIFIPNGNASEEKL